MTNTDDQAHLGRLLDSIRSLPCWYVSTGGVAGSTFQLALGEKMPRRIVLKNAAHTEEFRRCEGEANLLVWCAWRLDGPEGPVSSWDNSDENTTVALHRLVGATINSVAVRAPAWDIDVSFSNGLTLHIFCDHVSSDSSFDGNWELWLREQAVFVGPGSRFRLEAPLSRRYPRGSEASPA